MDQLWHWGWTQARFSNPILNGIVQGQPGQPGFHVADNPYDANLWTLPIEFQSSLVVFMFLMAFTRLHNKARMVVALAAAVYLQWNFVFWTVFLFLGGMLLCDLHFETEELQSRFAADNSRSVDPTTLPFWNAPRRDFICRAVNEIVRSCVIGRILSIATFVFALYLLSTPENSLGAQESFGYVTITSLIPQRFGDELLVPLGAVILVLAVDRAEYLQVLFTNPLAQYMGRISFSLYLIHGPLLWSLGLKFGHFTLGFTGEDSDGEYVLGILFAACLWWTVVVYLADLTTTYIDNNCVRFSKWAYGKLSKRET